MKKSILFTVFLLSAVLFVSASYSTSAITITPAPVNNEFDFNNQNLAFSVTSDVYTGTPSTGTLEVYTNGASPQNISLTSSGTLVIYSSPSAGPFVMNNLATGTVLKFVAYINNEKIAESSITVKPTAPAFSNFALTKDTLISGESADISIDVTDASGLSESLPVSTKISVGTECTPATLREINKNLTKKEGTTNTYQVLNYTFEHPCVYTILFSAEDKYKNAGTFTPSVLSVKKQIAADLASLKTNYFVLTDNDLNLVLDSSVTRFAEGVEYTFNLDSTKYGVHGIKYAFNNNTDKKTIVSETTAVSGADFKPADDLAYIGSLKDGFKVDFTGSPLGTACFKGNVTVEKDVILYCSKATASECNTSEWSMKQIDYTTGCAKKAEPVGSFFVLATCNNDYWDSEDKVCKTSIVSGDDSDSSDTPSDTIKKTTVKGTLNPITAEKKTDMNTTGTTNKSEGGILSGFGSFLLDNKGTTIPIGIGIVLAIGLGIFIVMRKGGLKSLKDRFTSKASSSSDKPSIHELAKKHEVNKPTNPKDARKLKEFADVAIMMGHNAKDLADSLKYRGWDEETVDQVFKQFGNR